MSTAGKVLIVLVLILVPIWIILVSGVAQVNTEGTKLVAQLTKDVAKLEEDVAKAERDINNLLDQISLEQRATSEHLSVIRSRLADADRAKTEVYEIKERSDLDLDLVLNELKRAEAVRAQREKELEDETEAKNEAENEVSKLKVETSDLMDELTKLREDFKSTLDSNRKLVERLLQAERQRSTRPALFTPSL